MTRRIYFGELAWVWKYTWHFSTLECPSFQILLHISLIFFAIWIHRFLTCLLCVPSFPLSISSKMKKGKTKKYLWTQEKIRGKMEKMNNIPSEIKRKRRQRRQRQKNLSQLLLFTTCWGKKVMFVDRIRFCPLSLLFSVVLISSFLTKKNRKSLPKILFWKALQKIELAVELEIMWLHLWVCVVKIKYRFSCVCLSVCPL